MMKNSSISSISSISSGCLCGSQLVLILMSLRVIDLKMCASALMQWPHNPCQAHIHL